MGFFGDTVSRVLTEYQADTSDMKAKVKELKGDQQDLAKAELEAAEARNQHFEDWIGGLAKLSVSFMAIKEIADVIWDGYKEGIHEARLETAAANVDMNRLSEAAGGLQTHLQLLEFAAKANKSAFGITQEQMETAERAMRALQERGMGTQESIDAVTDALVAGRTRGLEAYGIVVDKHISQLQALGAENVTLAQKEEIHKSALKAIAQLAGEVKDGHEGIGDSMERAQVRLTNSWDELKKGLGQLATSMQPLLEALGKAVGQVAQLVDLGNRTGLTRSPLIGAATFSPVGYVAGKLGLTGPAEGTTPFDAEDLAVKMKKQVEENLAPARQAAIDAETENAKEFLQGLIFGLKDQSEKYKRAHSPEALREALHEEIRREMHAAVRTDSEREERTGGPYQYNPKLEEKLGLKGLQINEYGLADTTYRDEQGVAIDYFAKFQQDQEAAAKLAAQKQSATQEKFLEKTFGKLSDFDAYHEAFKSLSGAISSAFDAWVTGSESVGTAFKRFIGDALKALASQMFVESLKHAAYAIGSVAFGDFAGAAKHAEAAAAFAAGAVVAGAAAKELGGGAAPRSSAGGGGASTGASSAPRGTSPHSGQQGGGPIIVVGDAFADDSPRMRQVKAARLVNQALGTSAGSYH